MSWIEDTEVRASLHPDDDALLWAYHEVGRHWGSLPYHKDMERVCELSGKPTTELWQGIQWRRLVALKRWMRRKTNAGKSFAR